jgi:hypothetical protein
MKVIGYTPLHYGKEYLRESLMSVIDVVDKFVVLYSPTPSHGSNTEAKCPDSEEELRAIAEDVCGDKLVWHNKGYHNEGKQRGEIFKFADGYDLLVTVDSDEIMDTNDLKKALDIAYKGVHRNYGINGYINLWRNFKTQCKDGFQPVRVINLNNQHKEQSTLNIKIWHFGCCQGRATMDYKYLIHGHKNELRANWLKDFYYSDRMNDLHPVAHDLWNAVEYDKDKMPSYLKEHPYFNLDRV